MLAYEAVDRWSRSREHQTCRSPVRRNKKPYVTYLTLVASYIYVRSGSWLRENSEIELANGNFVSTSINWKIKIAGDSRRNKTIGKTILRTFRALTFSRTLGHLRPNWTLRAMSGLPPIATELRTALAVRFVPSTEVRRAANFRGFRSSMLSLGCPHKHYASPNMLTP